jgi:hypothetical protein
MSWWPFGKGREPKALEILKGAEWLCSSCDQPHTGMIDLAPNAPDPWDGSPEHEPNSALRLDGDFLSDDFCVMDGKYFMVRCVIEIPVHGLEQKFGFGCWGSLSRANFEIHADHFDDGDYQGSGPWSSWLCNRFYTYIGTDPVSCRMYPQLDRQRPVLKLQDDGHPLAVDQCIGVSPEKVLEYYRHYGHGLAI